MMELNETQEKAVSILAALKNAYLDDEEKECALKLELNIKDFTADVTAMLMAMQMFVEGLTRQHDDIIGFTHMLNRLAVQYVMENQGEAQP